jgi:hypothetical protein
MPKITHTHALGMVTNAFQQLEFYLAIFTWGLMGKDQRIGQTVTAHLSFSKLLILVDTLFRHRTSDVALIDELSLILTHAAECEQHRNRVVHSAYLQISDDPEAELVRYKITAKLKKGLAYQWEQISIDELFDLSVELKQTTDMLAAFIGRVREPIGIDFSGYKAKSDVPKRQKLKDDDDVPF